MSFKYISERLITIRIKAKFGNIRHMCVHAPTVEKYDNSKDDFCDLLKRTYVQLPSYDTKIVADDFNSQLAKEEVFAKVTGNHSLHDNTSGNGLRLVDFASGWSLSL